jgi:hypothetical protein
MALARPSLHFDFANAMGYLDPRIALTRASTATTFNNLGLLATVPANAPRFTYDPSSGIPGGLAIEDTATNLLLYSEQFDNAAWTKTSASISANSTVAPDGNTTADTVTVSGANGAVTQAVTITAGEHLDLSVFAQALATPFLWLRITDGTNPVTAWFNLATGAVGTTTAGGSTCAFAAAVIQALPGGWYRCALGVTTATNTSYTASISAAAADNTAPANTNSLVAWGAQATQTTASADNDPMSYIATTSAPVTRNADIVTIGTLDPAWYNAAAGTVVAEVRNFLAFPQIGVGFLFSLGDTGTDQIGVTLAGDPSAVVANVNMQAFSSTVQQASLVDAVTLTPSSGVRVAVAWQANDFAMSVQGRACVTDSSGTLPAAPSRLVLGGRADQNPGVCLCKSLGRFSYWPLRLSNAQLQMLSS